MAIRQNIAEEERVHTAGQTARKTAIVITALLI